MRVITNDVVPAHARLLAFLRDEYQREAHTTLAARDLPDGEAWYQAQIRRYTTLDMPAKEIIDRLALPFHDARRDSAGLYGEPP